MLSTRYMTISDAAPMTPAIRKNQTPPWSRHQVSGGNSRITKFRTASATTMVAFRRLGGRGASVGSSASPSCRNVPAHLGPAPQRAAVKRWAVIGGVATANCAVAASARSGLHSADRPELQILHGVRVRSRARLCRARRRSHVVRSQCPMCGRLLSPLMSTPLICAPQGLRRTVGGYPRIGREARGSGVRAGVVE